MFHDSLVVIGTYSLLGHFFGAEVDFLFVTALLTILSFSVHDTIIVYDRIRESQRKIGGNIKDLANRATTETMVRSINNSFTKYLCCSFNAFRRDNSQVVCSDTFSRNNFRNLFFSFCCGFTFGYLG